MIESSKYSHEANTIKHERNTIKRLPENLIHENPLIFHFCAMLLKEIQYVSVYRSFSQAIRKDGALRVISDLGELIPLIETSEKCVVAVDFLTMKEQYRGSCKTMIIEDDANFMPRGTFGFFLSPKTVLPAGLRDVLSTSAVSALYEYELRRYFQARIPRCDQFQPDNTMMNRQMASDCSYLMAFGCTVGVVILLIELKLRQKALKKQ